MADIKTNKNKWIDIFVWRAAAGRVDGFDGKPSTLVEAADSRQGGKSVLTAKGAKERQGRSRTFLFLRTAADKKPRFDSRLFADRRFSLRVPSRP
jgi:hypothetical protein